MLIQDWDWDVAKEVWQEEAREEGREELLPIIAEKDAEIAALKAQLQILSGGNLKNATSAVCEDAPEYKQQETTQQA